MSRWSILLIIPLPFASSAPQGQVQELSLPVAGATRWTTVYQPPGYQPGAPVEFYRAEGGGHALPSVAHPLRLGPLARRLIGPVCRDVEGAELAWEFFKRHAPS